jgi:voltage-gated potassium channel
MAFVAQACVAAVLVALTLLFQSAGMGALIHWIRTYLEHGMHRFGVFRSAVLMVRFTSVIVALHLVQILLWAGFYRWNCFPSWESAFYFSAASYSTAGSGDLLLPRMWRSLGPVESVTGVLMCGLSAAFLFAIVTRLVERQVRGRTGTGETIRRAS